MGKCHEGKNSKFRAKEKLKIQQTTLTSTLNKLDRVRKCTTLSELMAGTTVTQGSSCLATLGFVAESLWDSVGLPQPATGLSAFK